MRAAHETCTWTIVQPGGKKVENHCNRLSVARLGGLPPNWASFDRFGLENNALGG